MKWLRIFNFIALVPCPATTGTAAIPITKKEESCFPPFFYSIKAFFVKFGRKFIKIDPTRELEPRKYNGEFIRIAMIVTKNSKLLEGWPCSAFLFI
ncbi:hypothetical protein M3204_03830 [Mesobacillus subterraneus]|nr:hypothetical protein [Mesobacillus subterraneus]